MQPTPATDALPPANLLVQPDMMSTGTALGPSGG